MNAEHVGNSIERERVVAKVTGKQIYNNDRVIDNALFVSIVRSSIAHGIITEIDVEKAISTKGVVDVISYKSMGKKMPRFGPVEKDQPILADGIVNYFGEPVVAVIAEKKTIAESAAKKIKIIYEEKEPVYKLDQVINHPDREKTHLYSEFNYGWGENHDQPYLEFENTYSYPIVFQLPLENYSCYIEPMEDIINIYSPIQHPFIMKRVIAECFDLNLSKVRVIAEEIGGGFGGKGYPKIEPLGVYIALKFNRAIKICLSSEEGFLSTKRVKASIKVKSSFSKEGYLLAQEINSNYMMGAYADVAPRIVAKSSYICSGPYKVGYTRMNAKVYYSNTAPSTAFRGFGMPQIMLAIESQMNIAANKLGVDPLKIRLLNLPNKGDVFIPGDTPCDGDWKSVVLKASELIKWNLLGENSGRSISLGIKSGIHGSTSNAMIKIHSDGSVSVFCGTTDMGQGSRTVIKQIVASHLSINVDRIKVVMGDTESSPFDLSTAGSRSTVSMGTAIENACKDAMDQCIEIIKNRFLCSEVEMRPTFNGFLIGGKHYTYEKIMEDFYGKNQGEIIGFGKFIGKRVSGHPLGGYADFWEFVAMSSHVNVDSSSGNVYIKDVAIVSDVGQLINHKMALGQESGGFTMGLGHALFEEIIYSQEGIVLNANPTDYKVPSIKDITFEIKSAFVENRDGPGPYGSKGLGESSAIPVGALISGAVYDLTGVMITELPITKEKLYFELNKETL